MTDEYIKVEEEVSVKPGSTSFLHEGTYILEVMPGMRAKIIMESIDDETNSWPGSKAGGTD